MNLNRRVEGGGGHGSRFFRLPGVPGVLAFHTLSSVDRGLRLRGPDGSLECL